MLDSFIPPKRNQISPRVTFPYSLTRIGSKGGRREGARVGLEQTRWSHQGGGGMYIWHNTGHTGSSRQQ